MDDRVKGSQVFEGAVRRALREDRFQVHAQRIVRLQQRPGTTTPDCFELLVRLDDSVNGALLPEDFFAIAERRSLLPRIDEWVLGAALAWLAARQEAEPNQPLPLLFVNLSVQTLRSDRAYNVIANRLRHSPIPPDALVFELSEPMIQSHTNRVSEFMDLLRMLGGRFCLEHLGRGFTSFDLLKQLPFDYVKLDRSLTSALLTDPVDGAIAAGITRVAHVLGAEVIAQGVSDAEILPSLAALGVDLVQGFAIDPPGPLADLLSVRSNADAMASRSTS